MRIGKHINNHAVILVSLFNLNVNNIVSKRPRAYIRFDVYLETERVEINYLKIIKKKMRRKNSFLIWLKKRKKNLSFQYDPNHYVLLLSFFFFFFFSRFIIGKTKENFFAITFFMPHNYSSINYRFTSKKCTKFWENLAICWLINVSSVFVVVAVVALNMRHELLSGRCFLILRQCLIVNHG